MLFIDCSVFEFIELLSVKSDLAGMMEKVLFIIQLQLYTFGKSSPLFYKQIYLSLVIVIPVFVNHHVVSLSPCFSFFLFFIHCYKTWLRDLLFLLPVWRNASLIYQWLVLSVIERKMNSEAYEECMKRARSHRNAGQFENALKFAKKASNMKGINTSDATCKLPKLIWESILVNKHS